MSCFPICCYVGCLESMTISSTWTLDCRRFGDMQPFASEFPKRSKDRNTRGPTHSRRRYLLRCGAVLTSLALFGCLSIAVLAGQSAFCALRGARQTAGQPDAASALLLEPRRPLALAGERPSSRSPAVLLSALTSDTLEGVAIAEGDEVEARAPDDGKWYFGKVEERKDDGSYVIRWPDKYEEDLVATVPEDSVKALLPRLRVQDLKKGDKLRGVVSGLAPFGAFVDVNADRDGLVNKDNIREDKFVHHPEEELKLDQEVDVWVRNVEKDGKLSLVMIQNKLWGKRYGPTANFKPFKALEGTSELVQGKVTKVLQNRFVVLVQPPDGSEPVEAFLHMKALNMGWVGNLRDVLDVGQDVLAHVEEVNLEYGRMYISLKPLNEKSEA
eukprot:TRINITY_DN82953_c0_g1_i1.p1 TRINITY_DN82953_c0_g1~~TRINITY_DN82953_c0_g1_i1.p1  ORF type:complete len:385 (-),score=80.82 TRINITY_DN82953_c0_g1_i1:234-1388(-)